MAYITLLSDFGLQDASVAIAKGIIMQHVPAAHITDITHEVQQFNIKQAAYLLGSTYTNFPAGTCHVAIIDIFSTANPRLVLAEQDGYYFLGPDNGILPRALGTDTLRAWIGLELKKEHSFHSWLRKAGDIMIALQSKKPGELGLEPFTATSTPPATIDADSVTACDAIHIDIFGNVVVDFTRKQYESVARGRRLEVNYIRFQTIVGISDNYNSVRPGDSLCRFNSSGYLEICVNRGKAAQVFGIKIGSKFNKIQISFK